MKKLLVFTDLDGTLLDHRDYSWEKATPALEALERKSCPVVINSSKTAAELIKLRQLINNHHPFVSENGSVASIPVDYFSCPDGDINAKPDLETHIFSKPYKVVIDVLDDIRHSIKFAFTGFNDMSVDEIISECGLTQQQARDAKQRDASEPILWLDTEDAFVQFQYLLAEKDLIVVKGGRFHHVMANVDKGKALLWLKRQYHTHQPKTEWVTIGVGDSFNDIKMLEAVDFPILVNNPEITQPNLSYLPNIINSISAGPKGWNEAILSILDNHKELFYE